MKRRISVILSALSLLLSVAFLLLWARSLGCWDLLSLEAGRHELRFNTWPDVVNVSWSVRGGPPAGARRWRFIPQPFARIERFPDGRIKSRVGRNLLNFSIGRWPGTRYNPTSEYLVRLPLWSIALLFLLLPLRFLRRHLRNRQRMKRGLCITCGYDLRASKDRCPECGELIPAAGVKPNAP